MHYVYTIGGWLFPEDTDYQYMVSSVLITVLIQCTLPQIYDDADTFIVQVRIMDELCTCNDVYIASHVKEMQSTIRQHQ